MRCLFRFHDWNAMKWGGASNLDCRQCRRCLRFEVWAYSRFYRANPFSFPDASVPPTHETPPDPMREDDA